MATEVVENLPPAGPKSSAPELDKELKEKKKKRAKQHHGFIRLKASFDVPSSSLVVRVIEARDLKALGKRGSDAYCKMYLLPDANKKSKKKTGVVKKTLDPVWDEEIKWQLSNFLEHANRKLQITIWDKDTLAKNDFLGRTSLKLGEVLPPNDGIDGWFELFSPEKGNSMFTEAVVKAPESKHIALHEYLPGCNKELLLRKGDLVEPVKVDGDWTLVHNCITEGEGYVPSSFIAPNNSLRSEPWFFDAISRSKAEKLLSNPMRKHGCFLIRESESSPGLFSLSMRDGDSVRHFRIESKDGTAFKLQGSPSPAFETLTDLVRYHKGKKAGLTTTLKLPCPKEQVRATDLSYETRDKWEVPRDEIELTGVLGQGQYGEVYRGKWRGEREVAVKTLKSESSSEEFLAEAQIMKAMTHANLVQLYAVCTIGEPIFIIIELMPNGCLLDYLKTPSGEALRLPTLIDMATDVAQAMAYIEINNFIHRDLAARNILVGSDHLCKVGDFGMARLTKGEGVYTPENLEKFPVRWTAPEAMAKNEYSIKSDVWSFGITLAEIVTYGQKPYPNLTNKEVVRKLDEGFRMPCPPGCPEGIYKIMTDCWKAKPVDRPAFESLAYRLEDFFHSAEANYTEASTVIEEADAAADPGASADA